MFHKRMLVADASSALWKHRCARVAAGVEKRLISVAVMALAEASCCYPTSPEVAGPGHQRLTWRIERPCTAASSYARKEMSRPKRTYRRSRAGRQTPRRQE